MVVASGPLAQAEFGWCLKPPTLHACNKIQNAIKKTLAEPRYASPDLRNLLRGHRLHFGFRALFATFAPLPLPDVYLTRNAPESSLGSGIETWGGQLP